jgi:transcriptional regulator with XRE-family HTH domain
MHNCGANEALGRRGVEDRRVDISGAVRSARRALGLSQRELAGQLEVAAATVANWESGRRVPSLPSLRRLLDMQGLVLTARPRPAEPSAELVRHLCLPLTARLRLALGEHPSPYVPASSEAWRALLTLGRLGRVVVQPPVATGIWTPIEPCKHVSVVVHAPHREVPVVSGMDAVVSAEPAAASLLPVTVEGPVRVWVLPPRELLRDDATRLELAADLLDATDARDDAGRRAPAHRDPDEWVEAARMLMTKGTDALERPMPELGRAWRLGGSVSLQQAVRYETWRRSRL